jgi:hypothetical protein
MHFAAAVQVLLCVGDQWSVNSDQKVLAISDIHRQSIFTTTVVLFASQDQQSGSVRKLISDRSSLFSYLL